MPDDENLFIKVPGYRHVLRDLVGVQQILNNMDEAAQVLEEVEEVKAKSIKVLIENIDRLNDHLEEMDRELPEIQDMEVHVEGGVSDDLDEEEIVDSAINDLRDELDGLRDELDHINFD